MACKKVGFKQTTYKKVDFNRFFHAHMENMHREIMDALEKNFFHKGTYLRHALAHSNPKPSNGTDLYTQMYYKCRSLDTETLRLFVNAWFDDQHEENMLGMNFSIVFSMFQVFHDLPPTDLYVFREAAIRDYILASEDHHKIDLDDLKRLLLKNTNLHQRHK